MDPTESTSGSSEDINLGTFKKKESKALSKHFPSLHGLLAKALEDGTNQIEEHYVKAEELRKGAAYFVFKNSNYIALGMGCTCLATIGIGFYNLVTIQSYVLFLLEKGHNIIQERAAQRKPMNYTTFRNQEVFEIEEERQADQNLTAKYEKEYGEEYNQVSKIKEVSGLFLLTAGMAGALVSTLFPSFNGPLTKCITGIDFVEKFSLINHALLKDLEKQKKMKELYAWGTKVAKFCSTWDKFQKNSDLTTQSKVEQRYQELVDASQNHKAFQKLSKGLLDNDLTSHQVGKEENLTIVDFLTQRKTVKDLVRSAFEEEIEELFEEMSDSESAADEDPLLSFSIHVSSRESSEDSD